MDRNNDDLEIGVASISLRRQVEEKLRGAIVRGRFAPGEHLSDRTLCEVFKVSRTVVREAVRQLEAEGLVETFPHRGSFVRVLTAGEAEQIYDVRGVLEALAAKKFVQYATDEQIEKLAQALNEIKAGLDTDEMDMIGRKQAFYDVLLSVYQNTYLRSMLNQILNWSGQLRATSMSVPGRRRSSVAELERLIEAIRMRDEEAAWHWSLEHVRNAATAALSVLKERDSKGGDKVVNSKL
jgi:DNA-binding GntR family transcriptional regulator